MWRPMRAGPTLVLLIVAALFVATYGPGPQPDGADRTSPTAGEAITDRPTEKPATVPAALARCEATAGPRGGQLPDLTLTLSGAGALRPSGLAAGADVDQPVGVVVRPVPGGNAATTGGPRAQSRGGALYRRQHPGQAG